MAVFGIKLEFRETVNIQNVRTMYTHKLRRIEYAFNLCQCLLLEQPLPFRVKAYVVVLSLNVVNLWSWNDVNVCAVPDRNTLQVKARSTCSGRKLSCR